MGKQGSRVAWWRRSLCRARPDGILPELVRGDVRMVPLRARVCPFLHFTTTTSAFELFIR